jgi:hypothetical protein
VELNLSFCSECLEKIKKYKKERIQKKFPHYRVNKPMLCKECREILFTYEFFFDLMQREEENLDCRYLQYQFDECELNFQVEEDNSKKIIEEEEDNSKKIIEEERLYLRNLLIDKLIKSFKSQNEIISLLSNLGVNKKRVRKEIKNRLNLNNFKECNAF